MSESHNERIKSITEEYDELMHYTTAAGLSGIITSGCLWATHASFLNDAEEINHFFDTRHIEIVRDVVERVLNDLSSAPEVNKKIIAEGGVDALVIRETEAIAPIFKEMTTKINQPHIFSLSAAIEGKVKDNGLLSQWRGYGSDGGYAIVFDTRGIEALLYEEFENYYYQVVQWGDVYYYGINNFQPSTPEITQYESLLDSCVEKMIRTEDPDSLDDAYIPITALSCLYKHWGFYEEREVRIIAIPPADEVLHMATSTGEKRTVRDIKAFHRDGLLVPYIEIFRPRESSLIAGRLPIKRIIVGPHPERDLRKKSVERLLRSNNYSADVVISDIPYIGR